MKIKLHIALPVVNLLFLLFLNACKENNHQENSAFSLSKEQLKEGDIAFRRGTGFTSHVVLAADEQGAFSHTGILKQENGKWYVIHAVPGEPDFKGDADRVKMEPVEQFFEHKKATRGTIMRLEADSMAAHRAAQNALRLFRKQVLFDHDYNLSDSTKLYCTELVDYVYRNEGIDLPEGRLTPVNIPGFKGDYLMPNDIAQSKHLCIIYNF